MAGFNMTPEEKQKILDSHKEAMKKESDKKEDIKNGLKAPEKKDDKKENIPLQIAQSDPIYESSYDWTWKD